MNEIYISNRPESFSSPQKTLDTVGKGLGLGVSITNPELI